MNEEWFYREDGENVGPVSQQELQTHFQQDGVSPDTLVWKEGMDDWLPYTRIASLHEDDGEYATCAVSGERWPKADLIPFGDRWVTAENKGILAQRMEETGGAVPSASGFDPKTAAFAEHGNTGKIASITLIATCVLSLASLPYLFMEIDLVNPAIGSQIISGLSQILSIVTIVFYLIWKVRSARNAQVFAPETMRMSPGWCAGFYFIPIAAFWKPYEGMKQIVESSFDAEQVEGACRLTLTWWLLWMGSITIAIVASFFTTSQVMSAALAGEAETAYRYPVSGVILMLAATALSVAAAVTLIKLIRSITAVQRQKMGLSS